MFNSQTKKRNNEKDQEDILDKSRKLGDKWLNFDIAKKIEEEKTDKRYEKKR